MSGRITSVNPAAQKVLGWTERAARGQLLSDVFHVVNADTRAVIDNPTTQVLREDSAVELADRSILIAGDVTERPIDNTTAPLRDEEGRLVGCVLAFRDVNRAAKS
jgi:PAS domain S-box-containing protein